jgi:hypothetical protein
LHHVKDVPATDRQSPRNDPAASARSPFAKAGCVLERPIGVVAGLESDCGRIFH